MRFLPLAGLAVFLIVAIPLVALEISPRLLTLEGAIVVDTAPRLDTEQQGTDGMTKTQFLVVCERHIVAYSVDGRMFRFTNMIPTTNFIKRVVPLDDRKTTGVPAVPPIPR